MPHHLALRLMLRCLHAYLMHVTEYHVYVITFALSLRSCSVRTCLQLDADTIIKENILGKFLFKDHIIHK